MGHLLTLVFTSSGKDVEPNTNIRACLKALSMLCNKHLYETKTLHVYITDQIFPVAETALCYQPDSRMGSSLGEAQGGGGQIYPRLRH